MVYELSNVLSNIGEQEISVYFKTTALQCAYDSKDLSEEEEKQKLVNCYKKIYERINKLPDERKERIKNTMDTFIKNIQT